MIERPSPNFGSRAAGKRPDLLILHYTGMIDTKAALDRLTDPRSKVSAHYLVDEDGTVFRLVDESMRAWHAGVACWEGESDVNSRSIGIELVNPGHEFGYRPFPEGQIASLIELAGDIVGRHAIRPWHVLGHSDVAPERKTDPGELFPWQRLARAGIGLFPEAAPTPDRAMSVMQVQETLREIGYDPPPSGIMDDRTRTIVTAFQRHWRASLIDGLADARCCAILRQIAATRREGLRVSA